MKVNTWVEETRHRYTGLRSKWHPYLSLYSAQWALVKSCALHREYSDVWDAEQVLKVGHNDVTQELEHFGKAKYEMKP